MFTYLGGGEGEREGREGWREREKGRKVKERNNWNER